jgi:alkyl sulfatase BDS1-like metallo-beta-lactamase superfamily hydrolase
MYLPDYRTALIADEVYIALPNLYTLRGAKFRDAMRWAAASEKVLAWDIDLLLGCHMPPLEGREQIEQVLGVYLRRCAVAGHCPTGDCGVMG